MPSISKGVAASNLFAALLMAASLSLAAPVALAQGTAPIAAGQDGSSSAEQEAAPVGSDADPAASPGSQSQNEPDSVPIEEENKQPWDCEPGDYWMMEGVDYSTPMACKGRR